MKLLNETDFKLIFKGDQNLFWDALITDSSLAYQLKIDSSDVKFIPFIHDEKLGAPDQNLIHCLEMSDNEFFISEDYADSAGDATYLNIDTSYGLFFLPVVEENRLKEFHVSSKTISKLFIKLKDQLEQDFLEKSSHFGMNLDSHFYFNQSFGDIPNREELNCFFDIHPEQRIFYIFTRALGRFGLSPVKDNNTLLSSIYLTDTNLLTTIKNLFREFLLKGLLEQSDTSNIPEIMKRYEMIELEILKTANEEGSMADLENNITQIILSHLKEQYRFTLTKSSTILSKPEDYQIPHFYLDKFQNMNDIMSDIYNISLNQSKMSIQRIHKSEKVVNLPFYINMKNVNGRYIRKELFLDIVRNELLFKDNGEFLKLESGDSSFVSGKAIPFLNELRYGNKIIALPEHGSKYTPACNAFIVNARQNGLMIPKSSILRISINFLDQLVLAKQRVINLPKVFFPFFGKQVTCQDFSKSWRKVVLEINSLLQELKNEIADGKEISITNNLYIALSSNKEKQDTIAKFMDPDMLSLLLEQIKKYNQILNERILNKGNITIQKQYLVYSFQIKLILQFYVKQLVQMHDGLLYLNDRPFSIALYLMFGPEFLEELIKNVTFRLESV